MKEKLEQAYYEDTMVDMVLNIDGKTIKNWGTIDAIPENNKGFYLLVTGDDEIFFTEDQIVSMEEHA